MKENKLLRTTFSASLTLDEFIFHQLKLLEDFESSWRELHRDDEKTYPLEMFAGDWLEQLEFWREHEDLSFPNDTSQTAQTAQTPSFKTDP